MCKLKKQNFYFKKTSFYAEFLHKKHFFTDVYFYKRSRFLQLLSCIKAGFLDKKAGFSKNIFLFYN